MATLLSASQYPRFHPLSRPPPKPFRPEKRISFPNTIAFLTAVLKNDRVLRPIRRANGSHLVPHSNVEGGTTSIQEVERPPFDLNLAVVLAGFAFEAYSSPPKNVGWREIDAAGCETVFLSKVFLREVYDGQLFIKLKKGVDLPALDPWGTSDPYVVMQVDGQVAKSKVKWATKEPTWNEDFTLNIKIRPDKVLQVAAWDANLVTPHKRMGNAGLYLESLCDGNLHDVIVELEGIGGGGKINLEVKYKSYDQIEEEKQWWKISFLSDFLLKSQLGSVLKLALGSEGVNARQFVQSAFGQIQSSNFPYLPKNTSATDTTNANASGSSFNTTIKLNQFSHQKSSQLSQDNSINSLSSKEEKMPPMIQIGSDDNIDSVESKDDEYPKTDEYFWKNFAAIINQNIFQKLGFSLPETMRWEGFELLNKVSIQSQKIAEEEYIESGLATPIKNVEDNKNKPSLTTNGSPPGVFDIKKASWDVLSQTEAIFGGLMVLSSSISQQMKDLPVTADTKVNDSSLTGAEGSSQLSMDETSALDKGKAEELRELFLSAESAMEAWAMLANSLGRTSFIKSEFEKICFLDNISTDTQVAIWRDSLRRRLVVAFRGTEQARWKDLRTDLMLLPAGLNPERLGGDFKQEIQVHSGFLSAYDSVRNRIISLMKVSVASCEEKEDGRENRPNWHVYVTGHSLGGALATLLALELSSSQLAKSGVISVTMYNFGSPRVGNKRFAEVYNEKVKDSWRIVNHRDIIPTVPRMMGYCHVAQPVYLAAGDWKEALENMEFLGDGYQADVIGESTPDYLFSEFMKGEKQLVEKILQTEISLLRSIRDGTALMQHMEDFYYITLLESVRSNYETDDILKSGKEGFTSTM